MTKKYYRDCYGNTASIAEKPDGFQLICRDYNGKAWKNTLHASEAAALSALRRTGEGWTKRH